MDTRKQLAPEFVEKILRCPITLGRLSIADAGLIAELNRAIAEQGLRTVGGDDVREPLEAALVREDGLVLYRVVDGIPSMLADEAIVLSESAQDAPGGAGSEALENGRAG